MELSRTVRLRLHGRHYPRFSRSSKLGQIAEPRSQAAVLGRTFRLEDRQRARTERTLFPAGDHDLHGESTLTRINFRRASIRSRVRSVLTCKEKYGYVCGKCFGRDLSRAERSCQHGRSRRYHRGPVHRRARNPAHHAYVPHRWNSPDCGRLRSIKQKSNFEGSWSSSCSKTLRLFARR